LQAVEQLREISKVQESKFADLSRTIDNLKRNAETARLRAGT
jgi:hypothetical protein